MTRLVIIAALSLAGAAGAEYAQVGVLNRGSAWEVGVSFDENVDLSSAIQIEDYTLSSGTINGLRIFPEGKAVILSVSDLAPNADHSLSITNISNVSGEDLGALTRTFRTGSRSWTVVGANELGFQNDSLAVGANGFDLVSGGSQLFDSYDEATFVYERLTGDFDKRVRVEFQESSSTWARAGLMAREVLDEGRVRPVDPTDPAEQFGRFIEVHATPAQTATGEAASNYHEIVLRRAAGEQAENFAEIQNNAPGAYPNAWVRLTRTGSSFSAYRSIDGSNWILLGTTQLTMPETLFVGPMFSPENLNIPFSSGRRGEFLAKFREYSGTGASTPERAVLSIRRLGELIEVTWNGASRLQMSTSLSNPNWVNVDAVSPYRFQPSGGAFFQTRLE